MAYVGPFLDGTLTAKSLRSPWLFSNQILQVCVH